MLAIDSQRPNKFYLYSNQDRLERNLTLGEFLLRPLEQLAPVVNYLALRLAWLWNDSLFAHFAGTDGCLIIHDTEEFGERIHRAAQMALPSWAGIDAAISYGAPSPLGAAFSRSRDDAMQNEWMFAWRPIHFALAPNPIAIRIGSIESIAEIRPQDAREARLH